MLSVCVKGLAPKSLSRVIKYITEEGCAGFAFASNSYIEVGLGFTWHKLSCIWVCSKNSFASCMFSHDKFMESQNGRGWKSPLEVMWSTLPAQAGPPRATCPGIASLVSEKRGRTCCCTNGKDVWLFLPSHLPSGEKVWGQRRGAGCVLMPVCSCST